MILTVNARPSDHELINRLNRKKRCIILFRDAASFDLARHKRYRCGRKSLLEREVAAHNEQMVIRMNGMHKKHKRTKRSTKMNSLSRRH